VTSVTERAEPAARYRFPVLTTAAAGIAITAAIVQYAVPSAVAALQRAPGGLPPGQWWRLVTPLLVQTLGWYQVAANLVTLVVIGVIAERLLGRWRWLVLAASGTAGGQAAAYAWHQPGGGDSIAIAGLAGGTAVALLHGRPPRAAAQAVLYYIAALGGWALTASPNTSLIAAVLACALTAAFLNAPPARWRRAAERTALAATAPGAALIAAARHDLHGVSLLAGMAAMIMLLAAAGPAAAVRRRH